MARDRTRYNFNGKERLTKKSLIFEVVKKYLSDHEFNSSIRELENIFSKRSDFNIDMFVNEDTYQNFNDDRKRRYFSQPFILKNNQKVYLSNQWGGEVFQSLLNRLKNDGHQIQVYGNAGRDESPKRNLGTFNIIIYGVPGVGKTHNIAKLISLIEEGMSEREIFDAIRKNEHYGKEALEDIQDRVEFVTFHQSFGYEDFIEGFRPNEDGKIELVEGIFKSLSLRAKENLKKSSTSSSFDFEQFLSDYVTYVESQEKFELDKDLYLEVLKKSNGDFLSFRTKGRVRKQSLTKNIILRDFEKFLNGEIRQYQDIKPTYESQSSYHGNAPYYFKLFENMKSFLEQQVEDNYESVQEERKNYYLIIDEINRGNISKIFGELITLIEEDKRDTYEATLPYSKEKFSVPSNLYIIGTMNSTDKSIALIDIALRRRFTFLKMQPNDDLVPEFAKDLFNSLNENISERLGDEYQIGHSYFMNIENEEDLEFVLEYKIKPLLEEYFYGDKDGLLNVLELISQKR